MYTLCGTASSVQKAAPKNRGIVIILVALTVFVIIGLAGLAIDLCRVYITQNELQNFTDSGAIWAVSKLDGTNPGIAAARVAALPETDSGSNVNRWSFGHEKVRSGVTTVEFATDAAGPFVANPPTPLGYRFARVSTQSTIPVYFASIFPGVGFNSIVGAFSIAGQGLQTAFGDGLFPFSPDAHNCGDPNYGLLYGGLYTLRWGNPTGNYDPNDPRVLTSIDGVDLVTCTGSMDIIAKQYGFQPGTAKESQDQRGYIDLGRMLGAISGGGGAALIRNVIFGQASFKTKLKIGDFIEPAPGAKATITKAMRGLVASDGDPGLSALAQGAESYYAQIGGGPYAQQYIGGPGLWPPDTGNPAEVWPPQATMNGYPVYRPDWPDAYHLEPDGAGTGERMVIVPVNCGTANGVILGFAGMLLPSEPCPLEDLGSGALATPCCAYYIGPATPNGASAGLGTGGGAFRIMLFR